ncbi:helix-turn-helix domain-containing protein [Pyxidicoccus parkwayensis]|uniref:Helix-turn-helix domain-containing protein n=1 Tax=Pyxidicoccus parkwayensis TaxID=2813578 RepID=A0ABX7NN80_9BACT|nr:helix-turn-helix domain-containing protein [Pyxidicoccus parkwaysis]QSQ20118.1 helix-turn-helix domain-containing protein [Pyxidicoccus parkwaysis]
MAFTIIVLEGAFAAGVAATLDMLQAARTLGDRSLSFEVCSVDGGPVPLSSHVSIETSRLRTGARDDRTTWVIPGLGTTHAAAVRARLARPDALKLSKAIARHVSRGGRVAASCSAVFLLQQAGVLAQRRATTTWWLARLLAEMDGECTVDANAMVCADGPVITAGAAFAQTDLMLHLLRERCGARLVDLLARTLLLDGRQAQAKYVAPELLANGDALIGRITSEIEAHFPNPPSVARLASRLGMTERTLSRHVHRVTGRSTLALVHSVKLRRAQTLLQSTRMSVDDVAAEVGYQDAGALRRLLKKLGGGSPRALRSAS